jgi:hypothetical protein
MLPLVGAGNRLETSNKRFEARNLNIDISSSNWKGLPKAYIDGELELDLSLAV